MSYVRITESEMDEFLKPKGFRPLNVNGTKEKVYGKRVDRESIPLSLRVYSSIWNGTARDKGSDAIRVELFKWDSDRGKPVHVGHGKRVHRIDTWRKNLGKRILDIGSMFGPLCPNCGDMMVLRSGSNGKFWGCSNYQKGCKGTRSHKSQ